MIEIVEKAIRDAGGIVALGKSLGISHQSVYSWKKVPADKVLAIEAITGVSRHEIRPDVFGEPEEAA